MNDAFIHEVRPAGQRNATPRRMVGAAGATAVATVAMVAMAAAVAVLCGGCGADNGIGGAIWEKKYGVNECGKDGTAGSCNTVVIGGMTWMAENLNYDTVGGVGSWCYGNNPQNCKKYGRLYDWNTAMAGSSSSNTNPSGVRGVCPKNWHLPSQAEWQALVDSAGGDSAGSKLKSTYSWYNSGNGTDKYRFSALPGGYRYYSDSTFYGGGSYGNWWTATESTGRIPFYRRMNDKQDGVDEKYDYKNNGFSVRCVADY